MNTISSKSTEVFHQVVQNVVAEVVHQTAVEINSGFPFEEVIQHILACTARVVPFHDVSHVMLIESGIARTVSGKAFSAYGQQSVESPISLPVASAYTLSQMVKTREPLAISDRLDLPEWIELPGTEWMRSFVGAPILISDKVAGFISCVSAVPNTFSQTHANRLQAFADQASIALQNTLLYEEMRQEVIKLEKRITQTTAELELERRKLKAILDATGEGILYTEDGRIAYTNHSFSLLTGFESDEVDGQPLTFRKGNDPNKKLYDIRKVTPETGGVWRGETRVQRKDGSEFDAGITVSLVGTLGNNPLRTVTVLRDISQEKALQEQKD